MSGEIIIEPADQPPAVENTGFIGSDVAPNNDDTHTEALVFNSQFDEATELLRSYGVDDMASEMIAVHGRHMSVAYGMASCKPFKESIQDTVEDLQFNGVTDQQAIQRTLHRKLQRQVERAPKALPGDAEKKSAPGAAA